MRVAARSGQVTISGRHLRVNVRLLSRGYEQYDARLQRVELSPVVMLTCWSALWPSSASRSISPVWGSLV